MLLSLLEILAINRYSAKGPILIAAFVSRMLLTKIAAADRFAWFLISSFRRTRRWQRLLAATRSTRILHFDVTASSNRWADLSMRIYVRLLGLFVFILIRLVIVRQMMLRLFFVNLFLFMWTCRLFFTGSPTNSGMYVVDKSVQIACAFVIGHNSFAVLRLLLQF